jgi:hypothetical protein
MCIPITDITGIETRQHDSKTLFALLAFSGLVFAVKTTFYFEALKATA